MHTVSLAESSQKWSSVFGLSLVESWEVNHFLQILTSCDPTVLQQHCLISSIYFVAKKNHKFLFLWILKFKHQFKF